MNTDLRSRNEYFSTDSISIYYKEYASELSNALATVDQDQLELAGQFIKDSTRIYVGGNGGSAAISDHLVCDFVKGTFPKAPLHVHSLTGSLSLFTALANDEGYEKTFSRQLEMANFGKPGDVLILISSSGNSKNILEAASFRQNARIIGLTGFSGGRLKELSDASLHVNYNNYGIVEDCHQILMHVIAQYHYKKHE